MFIKFQDKYPQIEKSSFVAEGAQIIGDVKVGDNSSIWYNCVLRGDISPIIIGKYSNIQDGSVLHVDRDKPLIIADYVTVGHGVCLHACTINKFCLIGIGSTILSGSTIEEGTIIGAGAVVSEKAYLESGWLYVGIPAKPKKKLDDDVKDFLKNWAVRYHKLAMEHKKGSN